MSVITKWFLDCQKELDWLSLGFTALSRRFSEANVCIQPVYLSCSIFSLGSTKGQTLTFRPTIRSARRLSVKVSPFVSDETKVCAFPMWYSSLVSLLIHGRNIVIWHRPILCTLEQICVFHWTVYFDHYCKLLCRFHVCWSFVRNYW